MVWPALIVLSTSLEVAWPFLGQDRAKQSLSPQGNELGVKAEMPRAFSAGAMAKQPPPQLSSYPVWSTSLPEEWNSDWDTRFLRLGRDHSENGATFQKAELLNLEKAVCRGQEPCLDESPVVEAPDNRLCS